MTGQRPTGEVNALAEQNAVYDPVFWDLGDLPDGAAYDITGRTYTVTVDEDSAVSVRFGKRQVTVTGVLRDEDSAVRVAATHELVAPVPSRAPQ